MNEGKMSYEQAAELVRRELLGEIISEAALTEALETYPEIGRTLEGGLVQAPPKPDWAKAGLQEMVALRRAAEQAEQQKDRFLFQLPSTQKAWSTSPEQDYGHLIGVKFLASTGTLITEEKDVPLLRVMRPKPEIEEPAFTFEKTVEALKLVASLAFYERPRESESGEGKEEGWYEVAIQLQALDETGTVAGWQVSLQTDPAQPVVSGVCNEAGQLRFLAVCIPDIERIEVTIVLNK